MAAPQCAPTPADRLPSYASGCNRPLEQPPARSTFFERRRRAKASILLSERSALLACRPRGTASCSVPVGSNSCTRSFCWSQARTFRRLSSCRAKTARAGSGLVSKSSARACCQGRSRRSKGPAPVMYRSKIAKANRKGSAGRQQSRGAEPRLHRPVHSSMPQERPEAPSFPTDVLYRCNSSSARWSPPGCLSKCRIRSARRWRLGTRGRVELKAGAGPIASESYFPIANSVNHFAFQRMSAHLQFRFYAACTPLPDILQHLQHCHPCLLTAHQVRPAHSKWLSWRRSAKTVSSPGRLRCFAWVVLPQLDFLPPQVYSSDSPTPPHQQPPQPL